jgi:hypothetical protein
MSVPGARSKRLAKAAEFFMAMVFGLFMTSVMLLTYFLDKVKHLIGESAAVLLFFSALLLALSLLHFMAYIRTQCLAVMEKLREHIDARLGEVATEMRQKPPTSHE